MECDRKLCKIAQECSCGCASKAEMLYCTPKKKVETLDDLKELLAVCLAEFWENNSDLIINKVYEPAISGKVAMILFRTLCKDYPFFIQEKLDIDVEYNKCLKDPKTIHKKCETCKTSENVKSQCSIHEKTNIRPDIVFHKRLRHEHNKCVFEVKRSTAKKPAISKANEYQRDYKKLRALTCHRLGYKYTWGIHLTFFNSETVVQIFQTHKQSNYKYDRVTKKLVDM